MGVAFAAPPGSEWSRVSRRYVWYRRLVLAAVLVPGGGAGAFLVGGVFTAAAGAAWVVACVVLGGLGWYAAVLTGRSWAYAEGQADLYLCHGVVVRQLVVVPYGRMQLVDVTANLLEQGLGIATVRVYTAASTVEAYIAGLPLDEATRLRDRLAMRSETYSTGL